MRTPRFPEPAAIDLPAVTAWPVNANERPRWPKRKNRQMQVSWIRGIPVSYPDKFG